MIRPCEKQMSRVLRNILGLSGGGEQEMKATYLASWVMFFLKRLKNEKEPATQIAFQLKGLICARALGMERA